MEPLTPTPTNQILETRQETFGTKGDTQSLALAIYKASEELANRQNIANLRNSLTYGLLTEPLRKHTSMAEIINAISPSPEETTKTEEELADIVKKRLEAVGVPSEIASAYSKVIAASRKNKHLQVQTQEQIEPDEEAIKAVKLKIIKRELMDMQKARVAKLAKDDDDPDIKIFETLFSYLEIDQEKKDQLIALQGDNRTLVKANQPEATPAKQNDHTSDEVNQAEAEKAKQNDDPLSKFTREFQRPVREMIGELLRRRIIFGEKNNSLKYDEETINILAEIKNHNISIYVNKKEVLNKEQAPDPYENMALAILSRAAKNYSLASYNELIKCASGKGLLSSQEATNKLEHLKRPVSEDLYKTLITAHIRFQLKQKISELKNHYERDRFREAIEEIIQVCYEKDDFYFLIGLINTLHEMNEDEIASQATSALITELLKGRNKKKQSKLTRAISDHAYTFFFKEYLRQIRGMQNIDPKARDFIQSGIKENRPAV